MWFVCYNIKYGCIVRMANHFLIHNPGTSETNTIFPEFCTASVNMVEQKRFFLFAELRCGVRGCVMHVGGARCKADALALVGFGGGRAVA